jgi:hypothetical protein
MRARQRHFNARDAGATCVYDARFISGISDGGALTTWSNRTGTNDASQSAATQKPVYKTNQLNGNPVVEFNASETDRMQFNKQDASQAYALLIIKRTSTNTYQNVCTIINTAGTNTTFQCSVHNDAAYGPVILGSGGAASGAKYAKGGTLRQDAWRSLFNVWLGGGTNGAAFYNAFDDGVSISLTDSGDVGAGSGTNSFIGYTVSSFGGQMAALIVGFTTVSSALRKRLSHSSAYSFKLACS